MKSLHFLIMIFAKLSGEKWPGSSEFNFLYISPLKSLNLVLMPSTNWMGPPGHLDRGTYNHGKWDAFYVCVKCITLCNSLCFSSPSSRDFASIIQNIEEIGAKPILKTMNG